MKDLANEKRPYEAPQLTVVIFKTEKGYALSSVEATRGGYDYEALSVNKLFVTTGGTTSEVTPSSATSELYVAVPAIASGHVTLTARSGSTYYDYVKTGVTFAQSQYYTINASLTQVKNIDERPAILGRVVAANGKMYASVESATNAGTTALTVIAQVDRYTGFDECMAFAISDECSKNDLGRCLWRLREQDS